MIARARTHIRRTAWDIFSIISYNRQKHSKEKKSRRKSKITKSQPSELTRKKNRKKTALDRGWTDHISLTHDHDDLQSPVSYGHDPTHMQKFKVNGQSVPRTEWKQMDGRTDGWR